MMNETQNQSEAEALLNTAIHLASHFVGSCFDACSPYLDKDYLGLPAQLRFIAAQLYNACSLSSESIWILLEQRKMWDADSILRSVTEGSIKFVYIMSATSLEEREERANEYWNILPKFSSLKRSERAKHVLDKVNGHDDVNWRGIKDVILTTAEEVSIRKEFDKNTRKALEQKWSFNKILDQFSKDSRESLRSFSVMSYSYGMSSHVLHMDGDGVAIIWERFRRSEFRQNNVEKSHACHILHTACMLALVRSTTLLFACNQDSKIIGDLWNKNSHLQNIFSLFQDIHNETEYSAAT